MTVADDIQDVRDELRGLYAAQRSLERAPLDGRVANEADRRAALDRNAESIRGLERRKAELEREWGEEEAA